ncbi:hypothetical protein M885DRAFT_542968 [Pelagophyceae sp. CCMP2097]|nr:hypothetical protein M885DRAFT_542968 [Pelagophyceae sp. CCMP2097]
MPPREDEVLRSLLAGDESVPCVLLVEATGLGHLDARGTSQADLLKGSRLDLPLWLADVLSKKNIVQLEMPAAFDAAARAEIDAGAMSVDLRSKSAHYYKIGSYVAHALDDDALRRKLRVAISGERFEKILDWSQNSSNDDVSPLIDKLTHDEAALFYHGLDATRQVGAWKARRQGKLETSKFFANKKQRIV